MRSSAKRPGSGRANNQAANAPNMCATPGVAADAGHRIGSFDDDAVARIIAAGRSRGEPRKVDPGELRKDIEQACHAYRSEVAEKSRSADPREDAAARLAWLRASHQISLRMWFIGHELANVCKRHFGKPGLSRNSTLGPKPYGPFIRFALALFVELGQNTTSYTVETSFKRVRVLKFDVFWGVAPQPQ